MLVEYFIKYKNKKNFCKTLKKNKAHNRGEGGYETYIIYLQLQHYMKHFYTSIYTFFLKNNNNFIVIIIINPTYVRGQILSHTFSHMMTKHNMHCWSKYSNGINVRAYFLLSVGL
jgi:hypothetical protein